MKNIFLRIPITHRIKILIISVLLFYLTYAFFSDGFYQFDEYFQIIQFANYKLGSISGNDLPWEFEKQIRPWLQVFFYYISSKILFYISPDLSSYFSLKIFHVESAFLSFCAKIFFLYSIFRIIKYQNMSIKNKKFILKWSFVSLFFWIFPYLSARTSSENFSSLFLLSSFGFFLNQIKNPKEFSFNRLFQKIQISNFNIFILGILFGFTFQFRYQCAFILMGASLWLLFNIKYKYRFLFFLSFGFCIVVLLGVLIDKWGYGNYQLTFYKYYLENIIHDRVSGYGISPWYNYASLLFILDPIFGIFIILFYIISVLKYPKNFFVWSSLLFIIIHVLIGHKEIRFLFPVFVFIWFPILQVLYEFKKLNYLKCNNVSNLIFKIFLISNSIHLICYMMFSPNASYMREQKFLAEKMNFPIIDVTQQSSNVFFKEKVSSMVFDSFLEFQENIQSGPIYFNYIMNGTDIALPDFFYEKCHVVFVGQIVSPEILSYSSSYVVYTNIMKKINNYKNLRNLFKKALIKVIFECENKTV